MKVSPKQYAQALFEATKSKNKEEINQSVARLFEILKKRKRLDKIDEILEDFKLIWNEEKKCIDVVVTSKEKLGEKERQEINKFLDKKYPGFNVSCEEKINEQMLGGIVIQAGDDVFDGSLSKQLKNLKKQLKSN